MGWLTRWMRQPALRGEMLPPAAAPMRRTEILSERQWISKQVSTAAQPSTARDQAAQEQPQPIAIVAAAGEQPSKSVPKHPERPEKELK